ncbi:MAG: FGGY-family carbohydrate kinase, partial [Phycisphaerales bacterium]
GDVYVSSGTWSLVGVEVERPVRTAAARHAGLTNEPGAHGATRLLRNVAGLWILQECRRAFESAGRRWTWEALSAAASETAAFRSVIDPDDARFAAPGLDMPERVRAWCREHGEPVPESDGAIARSILDGLALATAEAARRVTSVAGMELRRLAIVGGGAANIMLARLIAEAAGVPVVLGPTEATAIGNALVQHVALAGATGAEAARAVRRFAATVEGARTIEPSGAGRAEIEDARRRIDTVRTCENRTP